MTIFVASFISTFHTFFRMPHGRGHRRAHSYFSGFTVSGAVQIDQPIHKAVSSNDLHLNSDCGSKLPKTKSAQDLFIIAEAPDCFDVHEIEDEEVLSVRKQISRPRYNNFITIPSFVKHSVKQLDPSLMARPRSPKSKNGGEPSHQQMEDMLDQTLSAIRQQLYDLSNERVKMEQQMDDLINGLREARQQYHNQCRRRSAGRVLTPGSYRRQSNASKGSVKTKPPMHPNSLPVKNNTPDSSYQIQEVSNSRTSTSVTSQESIDDSPVFAHKGSFSDSLTSDASTHSLPTFRVKRSQSSSSSSRDRVNSDSLSKQSRSVSLSQDEWMQSSVIPELPESPRLSVGGSPTLSSKYNQSTPALHYHSLTAPRSKSSHRTSTPNNFMPVNIMTSSPDISKKGQDHYAYKPLTRAQRNSLPDSVMNSVILEDQVDSSSCYDSLSQLSTSTEDGSPKSRGSTLILRRSSLTGQLEHIRRPRLIVKRNSSFGTPSEKHKVMERPRCESACSLHDLSSGQNFKVLTRGYRKSAKRKPKKAHIILPSVETTV